MKHIEGPAQSGGAAASALGGTEHPGRGRTQTWQPPPKPSRCGLSWVPSRKEGGGGVPVRGPACLCPPAPASDTCPSSSGHMAAPAPRRSPESRVSAGTSRPRRSEPPTDLKWVESVLLRAGLQLLGSGANLSPTQPRGRSGGVLGPEPAAPQHTRRAGTLAWPQHRLWWKDLVLQV